MLGPQIVLLIISLCFFLETMAKLVFSLNIPAEDYLTYYQGVAKAVITRSKCGRTVQFPAHLLQPYVSHLGIKGDFEIEYNRYGKFRSLTKLN